MGYSQEEEIATQRKIYRYWRDLGIDVTSEFSYGPYRPDAFVGLQPMAWWDPPCNIPPELYCGSPMHAEQEIKEDPKKMPGLLDQFCLEVVPWHYRNNKGTGKVKQKMREPVKRPRLKVDLSPRSKFLDSIDQYGNNVFMPALWKNGKALIAYSREGYKNKTWELPSNWQDVKRVSISRITLNGYKKIKEVDVDSGNLTLTMDEREAFIIKEVG